MDERVLFNSQIRTKWQRQTDNFKVGDLVYVNEDDAPSLKLPLGRVTKIFTGNDKFELLKSNIKSLLKYDLSLSNKN